jgi:hypothetical protein
MIPVARLLGVAILLAGCGTFGGGARPDPVTMTAESAAILGENAVATNQLYVTFCADKRIQARECNAWSRFFTRFQTDYKRAHAAFTAALDVNDPAEAAEAERTLRALLNEIVLYELYGRR